ncbi:MAG: hypothetical protein D6758_00495 [Gammaproteobacteria bacterium]|nr:MAG: hypothetical protein D6758_00495 [Gammaproteobacteria bacterium]
MKVFAFVLFWALCTSGLADVRDRSWPPELEKHRMAVAIQALEVKLPHSPLEVSTVRLEDPNLAIRLEKSDFSIFLNQTEDVLGSDTKNRLRSAGLYDVQKALVFAATDANAHQELFEPLRMALLDDIPVLERYRKPPFTVFLWAPDSKRQYEGYVFVDGQEDFYRLVGYIDRREFEEILAGLSLR